MAANKKNGGNGGKKPGRKPAPKKTPTPAAAAMASIITANTPSAADCLTTASTASTDISSHLAKKHKDGAYKRDQNRLGGEVWDCACGHQSPAWHPFLAHIRNGHDFRGDSAGVHASHYFGPAQATGQQQPEDAGEDAGEDDGEEGEHDGEEHEYDGAYWDEEYEYYGEEDDVEMDPSPADPTPGNCPHQRKYDDDDQAGAAGGIAA
ncbi:hypothetical protein PG991_010211 [Apiospora marii]|uniref:Uncharacterized protein n=1 Tax=Apiospora marii TaxID=335849 RepID=A0ABR1RHU5_9PEZI